MIKDLELKLSGELPVNRVELITLVDSWGRKDSLSTDDDLDIKKCDANESYNLSNLDVSQIEDLSYIFYSSFYNGNLSNWNVSNCKDMNTMFNFSYFNNNSISNWDVSNVTSMSFIFCQSIFDGDLSNWDFNKNVECVYMFVGDVNFTNKYNNGNKIPDNTKDFLKWFEENREKMKEINNPKQEVLDFFSFDSNKELDK